MADPILGMDELLDGSSENYLNQNDRNLVMARLCAIPKVIASDQTYPTGSVNRGDMYVVPAGATSHWTGVAANTVAIALSGAPAAPGGWLFLAPAAGLRLWILAGALTGHVVYTGSAYVAV